MQKLKVCAKCQSKGPVHNEYVVPMHFGVVVSGSMQLTDVN